MARPAERRIEKTNGGGSLRAAARRWIGQLIFRLAIAVRSNERRRRAAPVRAEATGIDRSEVTGEPRRIIAGEGQWDSHPSCSTGLVRRHRRLPASAVLADGSRTLTSNWETVDANPITPFIATLAGATLGSDVPLYANFHTGAFPGGEIRGQLVTIATDNGETVNGTAGNDILPGLGGHDTIFGFAGNDTLDGGIGNDTLDGGTGNDIMMGGQGDDSYVVDNILDAVFEKPGEGTDTVIASTHYRLAANVENLVLQGDAITPLQGYGNELGNTLTGNDSVNLLNGLGGADMMAGGIGNDVYFVDDSNDQVIENPGGGNDAVFSSASIHSGGGGRIPGPARRHRSTGRRQ